MSSGYSEELKKRAKEKLLKEFEYLTSADYGKIEIDFNERSKIIEIKSQPHYVIKTQTLDKKENLGYSRK